MDVGSYLYGANCSCLMTFLRLSISSSYIEQAARCLVLFRAGLMTSTSESVKESCVFKFSCNSSKVRSVVGVLVA